MKIKRLVVGELESNCYLVWDEFSHEGVVIDPGADGGFISEQILDLKITPVAILLTHGHFDHVLGAFELRLNFPAPLMLNKRDEFLYMKAPENSEYWTKLKADPVLPIEADLREGQVVAFGRYRLKVLETPGHTPGSVCLYEEKERVLFSGDLIFADGVGRTDFSYSDQGKMKESLKRVRALSGAETYSGHGEMFYL